MSTALSVRDPGGVPTLQRALMPQSFAELQTFAAAIAQTDFAPKDFKGKPAAIIAAVTYGAEIGLSPMQALQSIAVINGKPSLYGDGMLAVCQGHPAWGGKEERFEGEGEARTAYCIVRRKGEPDVVGKFSVADAKKAGLWGKSGPWTQYSDRMLLFRARGFALRDQFADALKGIISREEAEDYPAVGPERARDVTPPGPIPDPAELVEITDEWGEVVYIVPAEFDLWLAERVRGIKTEEQLTTLAENNRGNTKVAQAVEINLAVLQAKARPPSRSFKVIDGRGDSRTVVGLKAAIEAYEAAKAEAPDKVTITMANIELVRTMEKAAKNGLKQQLQSEIAAAEHVIEARRAYAAADAPDDQGELIGGEA